MVLLSCLDADPASADPYLRAKGHAEELLRTSQVPAAILRAAHIYGPPEAPGPTVASMVPRNGRPVTVLGRVVPSLPEPLVDVMLRGCRPTADPQQTAKLFGLTPHRVEEVWQKRL